MTLAPAEPRTSGAGAKPEAGLLSPKATGAIGSAFNTLTETVKKHEPTLEDVVRVASPHAEVTARRKLARGGRANGRGRNRTGLLATLMTMPAELASIA
jgi:hypothetical protein